MEASDGRIVRFVRGYVPEVDEIPREARLLGLTRRCAIVLDSYRVGAVDAVFDVELYLTVLSALGRVFRVEHVDVDDLAGRRRWDWTDLEAGALGSHLRASDGPPASMLLHRQGVAVALLEYVPWVQVGGPMPYHDSHTIAVFSATDVSIRLESGIRSACEPVGAVVSESIAAADAPSPRRFWSRLRAVMGLR